MTVLRKDATAAVSAVLGALLAVTGWLTPLWDLVAQTSSLWFPALAVGSGTIAPELGYGDAGTTVLLAGASVYLVVLGVKLYRKASDYAEANL